MQQDVKNYGLNVTEFAVLELLYSKGPQPIQRIRDRVLIASSSISYVVSQLEDKGWITRDKDPLDKRVYNATLTDKGQQFMADIFPQHALNVGTSLLSSIRRRIDNDSTSIQKLSAQSTEV